MECRLISIGTLGRHPLWGERTPARAGHATSVLVSSGEARILVNPGLPPEAMRSKLEERTGRGPETVTHVFLTHFGPETCRGITLFEDAEWLIFGPEREAVGIPIAERLRDTSAPGSETPLDERRALELQIAILQRCTPAPDSLADRVDLFPSPGTTPGSCGLLLAGPRETTLLAGDAVPTREHLEHGQVLEPCFDLEKARESFQDCIEVADLIVPGRDDLVVNPTRAPF